jgi:hypothetical protein
LCFSVLLEEEGRHCCKNTTIDQFCLLGSISP